MSNEQRRQAVEAALSWGRSFIAAFLTYLLTVLTAGTQVDWNAAFIAALVAVLPVMIRFFDDTDPGFGPYKFGDGQ